MTAQAGVRWNFMDSMHLTYFEEMDELLLRAEACLIQLETGRSADDINELFRIAHSIKGSSMMIGYDPIGNMTHKLEDLLDSVRKGRIGLDSEVLGLCFEGLDCVKTMVESKRAKFDEDFDRDAISTADRLGREIGQLLGSRAGREAGTRSAGPASPASPANPAGGGIVGALKEAKDAANRRVYISVMFSDDAPMVQAVLYMIFHNIREIGSLEYSNITDDDIFAASADRRVSSCEMILNTDLEPSELYPYFEVMYVDSVEIIDMTDGKLRERAVPRDRESLKFFEMFFDEFRKAHPILFRRQRVDKAKLAAMIREQSEKIAAGANGLPLDGVLPAIGRFYDRCLLLLDGNAKLNPALTEHLRREYMDLLANVYGYVRGRLIFKVVIARDRRFGKRLGEMAEKMDRSRVRSIFVDVSGLPVLERDELAELIAVRRNLRSAGIPVSIIAGKPMNKRVVNVFDSIRSVEDFEVYGTELDAVLGDP